MSNKGYNSSNRHHSGGAPSRSSRSSGNQQYVLPATTYAGSGGGRHSNGSNPSSSSGGGTLGRVYGLYDYDRPGSNPNTPPRRDSQPSQRSGEIQIGYSGSNPSNSGSIPVQLGSSRAQSRQESLHSVYTTGSRVAAPVGGQAGGRPSISGERPGLGFQAAVGTIPSFNLGREDQKTIVYGRDSKSGQKALELKRNPVSKFMHKSVEKAKEKLGRKKK